MLRFLKYFDKDKSYFIFIVKTHVRLAAGHDFPVKREFRLRFTILAYCGLETSHVVEVFD